MATRCKFLFKPVQVLCKERVIALFIYGDSFCASLKECYHLREKNERWPSLVSKYLNLKERNYGLGGTSLSYAFHTIKNTKHLWEENSIIVFCETNLIRSWVFKDIPHRSHLASILRSNSISDRDKKWAERWFIDFYNEELALEQLMSHYYKLNHWLASMNLKGFVIRCFREENFTDSFSNLRFSEGKTLNTISLNECFVTLLNPDPRMGHLSIANHYIVAKQLVEAIKNNKSVDLGIKFIENCVNPDGSRIPQI